MSGRTPSLQALFERLLRRRVLGELIRALFMLFCFLLLMGELIGFEVKYLIQYALAAL